MIGKESFVGKKKMAAVHFTAIPWEPNTAHQAQGNPYFYTVCPSTDDIVYTGFEDYNIEHFSTFFMSLVKAKNYTLRIMGTCTSRHVYFFPAEDSGCQFDIQ